MSAQSVAILSSELFQTLIMLTGVVIVVASVVGIVCYIFQSISLYRIAKRRNIPAPGLAWVPIANIYLIGKIADRVRYRSGALISCLRKWLLGLSIGVTVFFTVGSIFIGLNYSANMNPENMSVPFLGILAYSIVILATIAELVLEYVALFHIFKSCSNHFVALFVLSLIFPITIPFFLFAIRNRDSIIYLAMDAFTEFR